MIAYLVAAVVVLLPQGQGAPLGSSLDEASEAGRTEASAVAQERAEDSYRLPGLVSPFSPFSIRIRDGSESSRVRLSDIIDGAIDGILSGYGDWYVKPALRFDYFGLRYESSFSF
jgi:hypothetical protein